MSYNFPILSIPIYYVLAVIPHGQAIAIASAGNPKRHDNRNPKSSDLAARLKAQLTPRDFAKWERAESCHRNHLENMPLYVASILAAVYAERETGKNLGSTTFAQLWLVVRILYSINYVATETQKWSFLRTALYYVGVGLCFTSLIRSAKALSSEE